MAGNYWVDPCLGLYAICGKTFRELGAQDHTLNKLKKKHNTNYYLQGYRIGGKIYH